MAYNRLLRSRQVRLCLLLVLTHTSSLAYADNSVFENRPIWTSGSTTSGGDGIARFIDFDSDGDLDFVTCAPNPRRWVLFRNEAGRLESKPAWESVETTDCDHIDVLDFNGDGLPDLAATHESHCTLYFNMSGRLESHPDWETGITTNANQISFGDFDQDGDQDMLMASGMPVNGIALFENTDGTPSKTVSRKIGFDDYSETAIFGDYDGDGDLDICASYGQSGKIVVYRNNKREFDAGTVIYEDTKQRWTQRLYWQNLTGTGEKNLFCAGGPWGAPGSSVQLAKQPKSPLMDVVWRSDVNSAIHGFDFGDVDLDGDLDVVAADWGGGGLRGVSVYLTDNGHLPDVPTWSVTTSRPGQLFCLNPTTGDVLWQGPGRTGENVLFLATPDHIVALINDGELRFIKATGDNFETEATYHVADSETWAPPVLLAEGILVKDAQTLTLWGFPEQAASR